MFGFNPGVNDMSGQILGQGVVSSAQTTADAQVKMVDDIGSALVGLAGAYGEMEGNKAKGRAFKDAFKVIAPSAGIDMKQLEALTGGSLKNDMDWYNARETMVPMLPSLINAQLGSQRNMTSQAGQQIQAGMPAKRAGIDNATDVAGGRKTYNPPDLFNVVPPPTPMGFGNINQGMPGVMGGQSMRPATQPMAVRPGR